MDSTSWEENVTFSVSGFEEITTIYFEEVNVSSTVSPEVTPTVGYSLELDVSFQIGLYVLIFLLAVLGNVLVLVTLAQNRGMRTITNLFLLNLAIADLLVGVLCMPFSLTGTILKDFIFGHALCKLIPYLQGTFLSDSFSQSRLNLIKENSFYVKNTASLLPVKYHNGIDNFVEIPQKNRFKSKKLKSLKETSTYSAENLIKF